MAKLLQLLLSQSVRGFLERACPHFQVNDFIFAWLMCSEPPPQHRAGFFLALPCTAEQTKLPVVIHVLNELPRGRVALQLCSRVNQCCPPPSQCRRSAPAVALEARSLLPRFTQRAGTPGL